MLPELRCVESPLSTDLHGRQLFLFDQDVDGLDVELEKIGNLARGQVRIISHPVQSFMGQQANPMNPRFLSTHLGWFLRKYLGCASEIVFFPILGNGANLLNRATSTHT